MTEKNEELIDGVLDWMRTVYKAYEEDTLPNRQLTKRSRICKECPLAAVCDSSPTVTGLEIKMLEVDA